MKITVHNKNERKSIEGFLAITLGVDDSLCHYYRIYPSKFLENGKTEHEGINESISHKTLSSNVVKTGEIIFISNDYSIYRIDKNLLIKTGNKYAKDEEYNIYNASRRIILKNAIPLVKKFMEEYVKSLIIIPKPTLQIMSNQVRSLKSESY